MVVLTVGACCYGVVVLTVGMCCYVVVVLTVSVCCSIIVVVLTVGMGMYPQMAMSPVNPNSLPGSVPGSLDPNFLANQLSQMHLGQQTLNSQVLTYPLLSFA